MNKYEEALDTVDCFVNSTEVECHHCEKQEKCSITLAVIKLQELVDKATPKKAIAKYEFRPEFDPNTLAIVDGDFVIHYHCPICGEWLSCDGAVEPDELNCFCSKCGQYIKGVEIDEFEDE